MNRRAFPLPRLALSRMAQISCAPPPQRPFVACGRSDSPSRAGSRCEPHAAPRLVPSGVALRYDFAHFAWTARRASKGSRTRMIIGASNTVQLEKNYNAGGKVADESKKGARIAHVTLRHDEAHPSVLDLPVGM